MNNRSLARLLLPIAAVLVIMYGSFRTTTPTWAPYADRLTFRSSGAGRIVAIAGASEIPISAGQPLELANISGVLAMINKKWILGPIARISNVPQPPWRPGDLEMRVTVLARKHSLGPRRQCFDAKDPLQSEWTPVPVGRWSVTFPERKWIVGSEWEAIKIAISIRDRGAETDLPASFPPEGTYILDFASPEGGAGLRSRVRRSIFSTIGREFEECP